MDGQVDAARERAPESRSASWAALEWIGLGAILVAFAGYTALHLHSSREEIETTERGRMAHQARIVEQMLGTRLQATSSALDALRADVPALLSREDGVSLLNERMRVMVSSMVGVRTFILVNRAGIGVASNRKELLGLDFHEGERYRAIQSRPDASALYVSPPFMTPLRNWALSLGRAVLDEQGRFDGYLLAIIDPEYFNLLLDSTRYAPDMSAALIHGGGLVVYRVPETPGAVGMNLAEKPDALFNKHIRSGASTTSWTGALQTTRKNALIVFQTIRPSKGMSDGFLVASFTRETDALFAPWRKEVRDRVTVFAVVAVASSLGLFFHQRRRKAMASLQATREAERKEQERALRRSAAELQAILDAVPAAVWIARDPQGTLIDANRFGAELLRRPRGTNVSVTAPADERPMNFRPMKDGVEIGADDLPIQAAARFGREFRNFEFDVVFDDGTVRHMLGNSSPIRGDDGETRGSVGAFVDITEFKKAEVALRESEERYRTLVTGMSAGLILQRADGVLAMCNPAAERILGLTAEQMQGRRSTDPEWRPMREDGTYFPGEEHAPMVALRTGKAQTDAVMALHRPDGTVTWVSIDSVPLRDDAGKVDAVLSTFVDISKLKSAETERNRLQAELAHAARLAAMGTLVAGVAHEINNPLAAELAGQGMAMETVRELRRRLAERSAPPLDVELRMLDETIDALSDAEEGGQRVARIVKDLATFASPDPHRSRLRLADVVFAAMRWLPASIARTATVQVEERGGPEVLASRGQVAQVILNLVINAAKATRNGEKGKIVVRTGSGEAGTAYVEVVDDGVGISPAVIDRIFDPFFTTRAAGEGRGSGLGLAISRSIVQAHGGTITVASELGKGSTFRVELPAAPAEA